jgi:hypothetical protein
MKNATPIGTVEAYDMSPERREMFLRLVDTMRPPAHEVSWRLHFLDNHFPPDKLDRALRWLIKNDLVGKKFVMWFKSECKNSDLEMHRYLLRVVDNDSLGPVIAGKNFKV